MSDQLSHPAESAYAHLSRDELATLVRELLLIGQMIDRSGMAWCISAFGRDAMADIAIEEWGCASPIYARRMQRALDYVGDDVPAIFKGLQFDIGAPHQFLDIRFKIIDRWHGEFWLDHCGALADVSPMGEDYTRAMCHDIEDPTFDATAVATNRRAQIRPIFRPPFDEPRNGAVCHWTVIIDDSHPEAQDMPGLAAIAATNAASVELGPVDPADEGWSDYRGDVWADLQLERFSRSALVRIADEMCVQMQLLNLSFVQAVRKRSANDEDFQKILRKQFVGVAGLAAARVRDALGVSDPLQLLAMLPMLGPRAYLETSVAGDTLVMQKSPAHDDADGWASLLADGWAEALDAAVFELDPGLSVTTQPTGEGDLRLTVDRGEPRDVASEVAVTRFSSGADWEFEQRTSLPLTVINA